MPKTEEIVKPGEITDRTYDVHLVPIDDIYLDEAFNCRGNIAPIDVLDLSKDIKDRGLDTPITLQPYDKVEGKKYRIVAGHRRFTAFEVNRLDANSQIALRHEKIPAFINVALDESAARTMNLRENLHRKQLNILEEANALKWYFDCKFGEGEISDEIGMSRGWVQVRSDLLKLPKDVQEVAAAGLLTQAQIKHAAKLKDKEKLYSFIKAVKEKREKGEKLDLTPSVKVAKDALKRRERKAPEIKEMKELVYGVFGPCLATRAMAWAEGVISTAELNNTIIDEARKLGINYKTPEWINKALVGLKE